MRPWLKLSIILILALFLNSCAAWKVVETNPDWQFNLTCEYYETQARQLIREAMEDNELQLLATSIVKGRQGKEGAYAIWVWVSANIRYIDNGFNIQLPIGVVMKGGGDCKNRSTLVVALAKLAGLDATLVIIALRDRRAHMYAVVEGWPVEPAPCPFGEVPFRDIMIGSYEVNFK